MEKQNVQAYRLSIADPTPLGLFGLAMVTLVASSQKLGITDGTSLILPWAIFLGGIARLIASIQDSKHHNIFGATAFGAFGLFWMGVGTTWLIQAGVFGKTLAGAKRSKTTRFCVYRVFNFQLVYDDWCNGNT